MDEDRIRRMRLKQKQQQAIAQSQAALAAESSGPDPQAQDSFAMTAAQFGAGSQRGIANILGFPVDAVSGGISGVGQLTGLFDPIENPVGGSEWIHERMAPLHSQVPEPATRTQRIARRGGEEIGAATAAAPLAFASKAVRANPSAFLRAEAGSAVGSGTGAALANEIAPDSAVAEIAGALLGGGAGSKLTAPRTGSQAVTRGGIDELREKADDAYARVRADPTPLPQTPGNQLEDRLNVRLADRVMDPDLNPNPVALRKAITRRAESGMLNTADDAERMRRVTMRSLPVNASKEDRALAQIMKDEITKYIDDTAGDNAELLREGRDATRRAEAASLIDEAIEQAQRGAATTGSGGNEINRTRQKLARLIENKSKRISFTADELAAMDDIAQGNMTQNTLRRLSRFAPTSGGLSAMLGIGGTMVSPEVALPIMGATEVAKALGERSTRGSVDRLLQSLAPTRTLSSRQIGVNPVVQALLAGRTMAGAE